MNYYIADLHIGHENVMRNGGRLFADYAQMSMEIVSRWKRRASADGSRDRSHGSLIF